MSDPYKCSALLNKGSWLDPGRRWRSKEPHFQNWQPPGCMMHNYKKHDIQQCFDGHKLVFIGDSTTRQIFWAVAGKMDQKKAEGQMIEMLDLSEKHKDLEFTSDGVTVQFIWDPWLNSTGLERELKNFRAEPSQEKKNEDDSAALILLGSPGIWYARHGQENFFKDFRDTIDNVIPYMDHGTKQSAAMPKSRPFPARKQTPNFLLLAPVQVPRYQSLSPSREQTITPEKIDQMNNYLQQASAFSSADVVWSYSLMTFAGRAEYEESGLHVVEEVANRKADVLLNLRCNADSASKGYPFNRTCCSNYKQPGLVQWSLVFTGMLALPSLVYMRRKQFVKIGRFLPAPEIMNALAAFGLVVCFCFYADRSQAFEKAQKQFSKREFLAGCLAVTAIGIISIRKNRALTRTTSKAQEDDFLSRDQTDEWKGWMQGILLVYHYTHASNTLWIYEIVRLLVASYLFMTGFGHALYFLRTDDYSVKRVANVLIRLNLLSCVLPYLMRTDYLFYYFAPLVSFWFFITYFTFKIGRRRNSNFNFVIAKIIFSAAVTTGFTMIPGILEFVSFILKYTCAISWNLMEWRFRMFLDMYIVYIGMILAVLYQRYTRPANPNQTIDIIIRLTKTYSETFTFITFFTSLFLLPGFWALIRRSPNKEDYNWWQPYISFIPILSFVTIRNSHRILRKYHSTALAWLGRCSLETYVLQYHIWLAGDTSGLLRIGLWGRRTEAVILTSLFLWISWCTAGVTQKLAFWIVHGSSPPSSNRGKFEDDVKNSPYLLPRNYAGDGSATPSKNLRFELGQGPMAKWSGRIIVRLTESLRLRLMFIGLMLWIGNILYT